MTQYVKEFCNLMFFFLFFFSIQIPSKKSPRVVSAYVQLP